MNDKIANIILYVDTTSITLVLGVVKSSIGTSYAQVWISDPTSPFRLMPIFSTRVVPLVVILKLCDRLVFELRVHPLGCKALQHHQTVMLFDGHLILLPRILGFHRLKCTDHRVEVWESHQLQITSPARVVDCVGNPLDCGFRRSVEENVGAKDPAVL